MRIGTGYDVHRLIPDRPLILGGVKIPFAFGLDGHSDADVLTHALMDAMLGALGLGDIGGHFPDTDPGYRDVSSILLLEHVAGLCRSRGYIVSNLDTVVIAERPKLAPFLPEMCRVLADALGVPQSAVSVKATTTEGLGFCGRGEGIAAHAVVLLDCLQSPA
jgi:2-C-methyl-D-erythritol 2,4-cyclodiphosphate synthase